MIVATVCANTHTLFNLHAHMGAVIEDYIFRKRTIHCFIQLEYTIVMQDSSSPRASLLKASFKESFAPVYSKGAFRRPCFQLITIKTALNTPTDVDRVYIVPTCDTGKQ